MSERLTDVNWNSTQENIYGKTEPVIDKGDAFSYDDGKAKGKGGGIIDAF